MKKIALRIAVFVFVLAAAIVIAANSSFVLKLAVDKFAPEYGVGYKEIKGNIFTGLQVIKPSYEGNVIADSVLLKWDPLELAAKRIAIKRLELEQIDTDAILRISSAAKKDTEDNATTEEAQPLELPFDVVVDHGSVTLKPVHVEDTEVKLAGIRIEGVHFVNNSADVKQFFIQLQTDIAEVDLNGTIAQNHLDGLLSAIPTPALYQRFGLPIRAEALEKIAVKLDADMQNAHAVLKLDAKSLLELKDNPFTIDIKNGLINADYDIQKGKLSVLTQCAVTTPYTSDINLSAEMTYSDTLAYHATIHTEDILTDENNFTKIVDNLQIDLQGGMDGFDSNISAQNLKGTIHSTEYKAYAVHLDTPEQIVFSKFVALPETLKDAQAKAQIDAKYQIDGNASNVATITLQSNIVQYDANVSLEGNMTLHSIVSLPKDSLLTGIDEKVRWENVFPLNLNAQMKPERIDVTIGREKLAVKGTYFLKKGLLKGDAQIGGQEVLYSVADENTTVKMDIASLETLLNTADQYYPIGTVPPIKGTLKAEAKLGKKGKIDLVLSSPQIGIEKPDKSLQTLNNIDFKAQINDGNITLQRYGVVFQGTKVYATKPSSISFKDDIVRVAPFWVNDTLKIEGDYKLKTLQGTIIAAAKQFPVNHEYANAVLDIDLKAKMNGENTSVNGTIWLTKTDILYDINQKQFASDSDIVIVQQMQKEEPSPFMDNLSAAVQIKSSAPLVYKQGPFDISSDVHLGIYKAAKEPLMVLGSIELKEGSSYLFKEKKFVLEKSYIYFTGKADKPLLDIKVKYKALNHLITLSISGSPNAPNINFSSIPKLTKEQILSILLFDSEEGAGSHSGEDMMRMMGGAMAKSALADMGIKMDHLAIGSDNSIEVGKKLTDTMTIIYINGVIPVVKLKYRHTDEYESVIGTSQQSSSYDIIFKKDYEEFPTSF